MVQLKPYNKTLCHDFSYRLHTMESHLTVLVGIMSASFGDKIEQRDGFRRNQQCFAEASGVERHY
jgi:hypothetical protein